MNAKEGTYKRYLVGRGELDEIVVKTGEIHVILLLWGGKQSPTLPGHDCENIIKGKCNIHKTSALFTKYVYVCPH